MSENKSLCVLIATVGRPTLPRMLESLRQLNPNDHVVITTDDRHGPVASMVANANLHCWTHIRVNPTPLGKKHGVGNVARSFHQNNLPGNYILHADDDDRYVDGAFDLVREHIDPNVLPMFQYQFHDRIIWNQKIIWPCYVGGVNPVIPNQPPFPDWGEARGGDGLFIRSLVEQRPHWEVKWIPEVIYKCRDTP